MQIQPNGGTGASGSVLKEKKRDNLGLGQKKRQSLDAPVAMATAKSLRYLQLAGHYHA